MRQIILLMIIAIAAVIPIIAQDTASGFQTKTDFSGLKNGAITPGTELQIPGKESVVLLKDAVAQKNGGNIILTKGSMFLPGPKVVKAPEGSQVIYTPNTNKLKIEKGVVEVANKQYSGVELDLQDNSGIIKGTVLKDQDKSPVLPINGIELFEGTKFTYNPNDNGQESITVNSPRTEFNAGDATYKTLFHSVKITPGSNGELVVSSAGRYSYFAGDDNWATVTGPETSYFSGGAIERPTPAGSPYEGQGAKDGRIKDSSEQGNEQIAKSTPGSRDKIKSMGDRINGAGTSKTNRPVSSLTPPSAPPPVSAPAVPSPRLSDDLNSFVNTLRDNPPPNLWEDESKRWNRLVETVSNPKSSESEKGSAALKLYRLARDADMVVGVFGTSQSEQQLRAMHAAAALRAKYPNSGVSNSNILATKNRGNLNQAAAMIVISDVNRGDLSPQAVGYWGNLKTLAAGSR